MTSLREKWAGGGETLGFWLSIPSFLSAEIAAGQAVDYVCVDLQHGVNDYIQAASMIQAIELSGGTPIVRVPWNEPGIIGKVLDAGAQGVICPMINSREECEAFVSACKYPPRGTRSNGPVRAGLYGEPGTYQKTANVDTLCIPMIETRSAVENLEAILDVEGVAGVYIGPSDLGLSYGLPPKFDRSEPEILAIYDRVIAECARRKIFAAIHTGGAEDATKCITRGFRLVTVTNDVSLMAMMARSAVAQTRKDSKGIA